MRKRTVIMPKISIIIAVYNVEKYLKQCLYSLENQTLQDIEIICVNDGSTDNSLAILKNYASRDNRFKIINQKNHGPGTARNNALNIATGDYIMIVDPDDWLELSACELAYNKITKNSNDIVFFGYQRYFEETGEIKVDRTKLKAFEYIIYNQENINLSELQNDYLKTAFTWTQIYSRKFILDNNVRYSETYLCEDTVFIVKAIINANSVSILDIPIYNYRIRKTSLSSALKKYWQDIIINRKTALKIIQDSNNELDYIYPYLIYLINSLSYWYKQISQKFPTLKKDFYNEMRLMYLELDKKYKVEKISKYINYKKFTKICQKNWNNIIIETILQKIFQLTNIGEDKILTIFGIKMKLNKRINQ